MKMEDFLKLSNAGKARVCQKILKGEENLNRCEAYSKGMCLFGCDAIAENFYNSEEALESNCFDYYLNKKECDTLKKCRERSYK